MGFIGSINAETRKWLGNNGPAFDGRLGRLPDAWVGHLTTMNTVALASVAGVYGANSVVGAWRKVGEKVKHLLSTPGKGSTPDFPDE